MNSFNQCKAIIELDLDPIKVKLMHATSGEGWTLQQASAVEAEYRRFLYLMKRFPNEAAAPLEDVDTFWHYHILDTMKYARDCEAVFGYFLHHFPYVGLRGEDDLARLEEMGECMRELYEETFGERYPLQSRFDIRPPLSSVNAIAYCAAPGQAVDARTTRSAFLPLQAAAYCSAPAQPASAELPRAAFISAGEIAYCSAPGHPASAGSSRTDFLSRPGIAYCAAPGQPAGANTASAACLQPQQTAYCSAPSRPAKTGIAYCSAPAQPFRAVLPQSASSTRALAHLAAVA